MRFDEAREEGLVHEIPAFGDADISGAEDPGHEELGEGEEIGEIDLPPDGSFHEVWVEPDEDGEGDIVEEKEDGGGEDEAAFGGFEGGESGIIGDEIPVVSWGGGWSGIVHGKGD